MGGKVEQIDLAMPDVSPEEAEFLVARLLSVAADARSDSGKFFSFVVREERTRKPLALLPHQALMFAFVDACSHCVIKQPVGSSKCVDGATLVVDPVTGIRRQVRDVLNDDSHCTLLTWDQSKGIHAAPITAKIDSGTKRCMTLRMRSGRTLTVTPEHPMLTPGGWLRSDQLVVGDTLAAVGLLPTPSEPRQMPSHDVFLLALLLSEGCTTKQTKFTTADPEIVRRAEQAAASLGCTLTRSGKYDYDIVGKLGRENRANTLCRWYGLWGCKSTTKRIPDEVFSLPAVQLAEFVSVFWMCDGYVDRHGPAIALANREMIDQLGHLLLRFGVKSTVTYVPNQKAGAWRLVVRGDSVEAFASIVSLWGHKAVRLEAMLGRKHNPNIGVPVVRREARVWVRDLVAYLPSERVSGHVRSWMELLFSNGRVDDFHRSASPSAFSKLFEKSSFARYEFGWWFDPSIDWDGLIAVEDAGVRSVVDFTMAPSGCFVANDLVAHNTWSLASQTLMLLGLDQTERGAVVSATQGQASKIVSMVSDYIVDPFLSAPLRLVFPQLQRSQRDSDAWTQTEIVVERPAGIRDPSLRAIGIDTAVLGSRLGWILCDDLVDDQNSATRESRRKVRRSFDGRILTRLDPGNRSKVVVSNTPWHSEDLLHQLEHDGWPSLSMSIYGDVWFQNVDFKLPAFASLLSHLRPTSKQSPAKTQVWKLAAHPASPLWPSRYPADEIAKIKRRMLPYKFAQSYGVVAFDDDTTRCKIEWVTKCLAEGNGIDFVSVLEAKDLPEGAFTVTGVDLAAKKKVSSAKTVLFTALIYPDGAIQPLWIDSGQFTAPEIRDKIIAHHERYGSIVFVEDNGVQTWMLDLVGEKADVPIWPHTTGVNKWHPAYGVESVFLLMSQGKWIIPNVNGQCRSEVDEWLDQCRSFNPAAHTGDQCMASWFVKEGARMVAKHRDVYLPDDDGDTGVMLFDLASRDAKRAAAGGER